MYHVEAADDLNRARTSPRPLRLTARGQGQQPAVDPDLSAAVSYSLAQTVEARLRGIRNYTRLVRDTQLATFPGDE